MKQRPQPRLCPQAGGGSAPLEAEFPFLGERIHLAVEAPEGRLTLADVVPLARAVCDRLTGTVVGQVAAQGRPITCSKGCGVCCTSYVIPLTVPEAFCLQREFQALPDRQRDRLESALVALAGKITAAGLAEGFAKLDRNDPASLDKQRQMVGGWWARERVPCPLLRDQSCSLYPIRPVPCREFLAVSPPQLCAENRPVRARWPFSMRTVLATWAGRLEDREPSLILMPNLLSWCRVRVTRARRTWRSPGMVRAFLDVLTEIAVETADTPLRLR